MLPVDAFGVRRFVRGTALRVRPVPRVMRNAPRGRGALRASIDSMSDRAASRARSRSARSRSFTSTSAPFFSRRAAERSFSLLETVEFEARHGNARLCAVIVFRELALFGLQRDGVFLATLLLMPQALQLGFELRGFGGKLFLRFHMNGKLALFLTKRRAHFTNFTLQSERTRCLLAAASKSGALIAAPVFQQEIQFRMLRRHFAGLLARVREIAVRETRQQSLRLTGEPV